MSFKKKLGSSSILKHNFFDFGKDSQSGLGPPRATNPQSSIKKTVQNFQTVIVAHFNYLDYKSFSDPGVLCSYSVSIVTMSLSLI